jgi:spore germination protein YaaH
MKPIRILSIIGIVVGTLLIISSSTLLFIHDNNRKDVLPAQEDIYEYVPDIQETDKEEPPEDIIELEVVIRESGWIPNWAFDLGYESLVNNKGVIDTVLPVLYTVDNSGNVVTRGVSEANIQKLLTYTRENNIRVIPTIGSYNTEAMDAHFASTEAYNRNIYTIVAEIEKYGFDGIDLDYEMISSNNKDMYLLFLKDLRIELKKKNKILSVTVFAQWDNGTYTDHQDTRIVQDYSRVGAFADEVRIMAYDYTSSSSKVAGPIGPGNWIRDVLDYATKNIPKEKIWLGVHLYGYQWAPGKTTALTYTTLNSVLNDPNTFGTFREDIGEGYLEYGCDGGRCIVYYQEPKGVQLRRDIAKEYGIAGISYWRLGGEMDILK